jgi:hypothetical protein
VFKRTELSDFILESYKTDDNVPAEANPALSVA